MSILVIAEHDNSENKSATLVTIAAAQAIGGDIDVLVAGSGVDGVASQVAAIPGVSKVLVADNPAYEHQLAENIGDLIAEVAAPYGHVLAPHTANGKGIMPRVAAKLGVAQVSDIISVESPDTFKRPIYAGNAIATVKSNDAGKSCHLCAARPMTRLRQPAAARLSKRSGNVTDAGVSSFVSQEIAESERPELTAA
jgi:electron transfer flavoprotein alpha subunit